MKHSEIIAVYQPAGATFGGFWVNVGRHEVRTVLLSVQSGVCFVWTLEVCQTILDLLLAGF